MSCSSISHLLLIETTLAAPWITQQHTPNSGSTPSWLTSLIILWFMLYWAQHSFRERLGLGTTLLVRTLPLLWTSGMENADSLAMLAVTADTLYPFGLTIKYTIKATKAFNFNVRIPDWAKNSQTQFSVNGGKNVAVSPDSNSFQKIAVGALSLHVLSCPPYSARHLARQRQARQQCWSHSQLRWVLKLGSTTPSQSLVGHYSTRLSCLTTIPWHQV